MKTQTAASPALMPSDEEDRKNFGFVPPKAALEPIVPSDEEIDEQEDEESSDDDEEQI